jgi:hypothetical protein
LRKISAYESREQKSIELVKLLRIKTSLFTPLLSELMDECRGVDTGSRRNRRLRR